MYNPFSLQEKIILITGASSGIGKATALVCAKLGGTVVACGRNVDRLNQVLEELKSISQNDHKIIQADLTSNEDINRLVEECPKIHGLVSNAGIVTTKLLKFAKEEEITEIWKTNTLSHVLLFQSLFKKKKLNKNSSIVFTASIGGNSSFVPGNGLYGMAKAAINSLTKYIAIEFAGKGIRCNNVCPGMIVTPMTQNIDALSGEDFEKDKKNYLLNRYGTPEEVAYTISFLLSDASSFITGQSLIVDGGFSINH